LYLHLLELGFDSGILHVSFGVRRSSKRSGQGLHNAALGGVITTGLEILVSAIRAQPPHLNSEFPSLQTDTVEFCKVHLLRCLGDYDRLAIVSRHLSQSRVRNSKEMTDFANMATERLAHMPS
jgi:hypothetical protein